MIAPRIRQLVQLIIILTKNLFYGTLIIKFEAGKITHMQMEQGIKPGEGCRIYIIK